MFIRIRKVRDDKDNLRALIKKQANIPGLKGGLLEVFDRMIAEIDTSLPLLKDLNMDMIIDME